MSNGSAHERTQFRDIPLPVPLVPAGYAAIIDRYVPHGSDGGCSHPGTILETP